MYGYTVRVKTPGPGCSNLTTSLVNVSLKFQTLISHICHYFFATIFCWKKCEKLLQCKSFSHFFNKNISAFRYKIVIHWTSRPLNGLDKLTMLWTTGPWTPEYIAVMRSSLWPLIVSVHGLIKPNINFSEFPRKCRGDRSGIGKCWLFATIGHMLWCRHRIFCVTRTVCTPAI